MSKRNSTTFALGRLKQGVMNKTEAAYESVLRDRLHAGEIQWYKFEGVKLRLADKTFYTPDFAVMAKDGTMEIHEVKGSLKFIQDDAKVKIKVAAELYPFKFFLLAPIAKKHGGGWVTQEVGK